MSSEHGFLTLRLEGPMQSWGFDSQYNRRNTGLMPTKSSIAGMCCAALGYLRGGVDESEFLIRFNKLKMISVVIPRKKENRELMVRRLQDYHTIKNTLTADGKNKDCHITYRAYLTDAAFGIILKGCFSSLSQIASALKDPKWGIWLGRKSCIPSSPVFAGLNDNHNDALSLLIGNKPIEEFTWQEEVENFAEGRDSLPDTPLSFATEKRTFAPRRIRIHHAINGSD